MLAKRGKTLNFVALMQSQKLGVIDFQRNGPMSAAEVFDLKGQHHREIHHRGQLPHRMMCAAGVRR